MSSSKKASRTLFVLGLVGLAAAASTTEASAGRFGGGGGFRGGFGGGMRAHFSAPRMSFGGSRMSFGGGRASFGGGRATRPAVGPHFGTPNQGRPPVGPHFGTPNQGRPPIGPHFGTPNQGRPLGQSGQFSHPFPQPGNQPFNQAGLNNPNQGQVLSPKCQFAKCHIMVPANTGTVMCIRAPCNVNVPKPADQKPVVMCIRAPCNVPRPNNPNDPLLHPAKNPCAFGRCQGPVGPGPVFPPRPYYPAQQTYPQQAYPQPAYQPQPSYTPPAPAAYAPAPAAYSPPAAAPAPTAVQQPTTVSVIFQPTATSNDIIAFIKAYNVTVSSGPDANGVYRLQISTGPVAQDQLNQIVQSMQGQTNIVSQIGA